LNIRNKSTQQLLALALAFSLFMLTVTTGQFVICTNSEGHIEIEMTGSADCEMNTNCSDNNLAERTNSSSNCSKCSDTVVVLNNIVKSNNDCSCNLCSIDFISIARVNLNSDHKISSLFTYLHNYKNFISPLEKILTETSVFLI